MRKLTATERGFLTGCVLTFICGFLLTWQADREGDGLQPSAEIPHPWLYGIAVNGLCVGVFVVPLATIFCRWIGDYRATRMKKCDRESRTTESS
jgi:hypothetical protein